MPQQIGPYRVLDKLGEGAMGTVHLAEGKEGERVAVKVPHPRLVESARGRARFLREAEAGRRVVHPNVVAVLASSAGGAADATPWLAMPFVSGRTLSDLLAEIGPFPEPLLRRVAEELCAGLSAIHAAGLVHRDLKPSNVLIGDDAVLRIMDLGLAGLLEEAHRLTATGEFLGTLTYAAPEQMLGEARAGPAMDLYALGVLLFELAAGALPFSALDLLDIQREKQTRGAFDAAVRRPDLSPESCALIAALTRVAPNERPASAEAARELLHTPAAPRAQGTFESHVAERLPFVGQDALLADFARAIDQAPAPVLWVTGEAGLGKSRFVLEGLRRLDGATIPRRVAIGHGKEALREALAKLVGGASPAGLEEMLEVDPARRSAFADWLRGWPPANPADELDGEVLASLLWQCFDVIAHETPLIVWLEDVHELDAPAQRRLGALIRSLGEVPIAWVLTARGEGAPALASLVSRREGFQEIALVPLDEGALLDLARALTQEEALRAFLSTSFTETAGGNPYFISALVDGWLAGGWLTASADGFVAPRGVDAIREAPLPASMQELVATRLRDLAAEDRQLLAACAVAGFAFDPTIVAQALAQPPLQVESRLAQLAAHQGLVLPGSTGYRFEHRLLWESIRRAQPAELARALHAAFGDAWLARVEASPGGSNHGAHVAACEHLVAGGEANRVVAVAEPALRTLHAGGHAGRAAALSDAVLPHLEAAVAEHREAHIACAQAFALAGRYDESIAVAASICAHADPAAERRLVRSAWMFRIQGSISAGRLEAAGRLIPEAAPLFIDAGEDEYASAFHRLEGVLLIRRGRHLEAEAPLRRAVATAPPATLAPAAGLAHLGVVLAELGRGDEAHEALVRARDSYDAAGSRPGVDRVQHNLAFVHLLRGHADEAQSIFRSLLSAAEREGNPKRAAYAHTGLGHVALRIGDLDESARRFAQGTLLGRLVGPQALSQMGRFADAADVLGALASEVEASESERPRFEWRMARARLFAATDRPTRAQAEWTRAASSLEELTGAGQVLGHALLGARLAEAMDAEDVRERYAAVVSHPLAAQRPLLVLEARLALGEASPESLRSDLVANLERFDAHARGRLCLALHAATGDDQDLERAYEELQSVARRWVGEEQQRFRESHAWKRALLTAWRAR